MESFNPTIYLWIHFLIKHNFNYRPKMHHIKIDSLLGGFVVNRFLPFLFLFLVILIESIF